MWAYVQRGPYAAFVVAEPGIRPGVLVDQLEQALLVAEEGRHAPRHAEGARRVVGALGQAPDVAAPGGGKPAPAEVAAMGETAEHSSRRRGRRRRTAADSRGIPGRRHARGPRR